VTPRCTVCTIDGGTVRGANLFHSFQSFSVPTAGEAFFNNGLQIQNIFSRVTGNSVSNIDGLLRANGTANVFFLNQNGIIFGQNATLNLGGSFVASTASSLLFADGTVFSAAPPTSTTPLLTISVPVGLQYETNPGKIVVQGDGQGRRTTTDLIDTDFGLRVPSNQTLALVGGDVTLVGATLKTAGGRIELGSVAGPGLVSLTATDKGWALGDQGVSTRGDIQLSQQAIVDASGLGGGDIHVWGRRVTLLGGSQIEASTLGEQPGGTLAVHATESVELIGTSANGEWSSGLLARVESGAKGAGGNLTLDTRRLSLRDGAQVSTSTLGEGRAGNLNVTARESVEVIGTSANGATPSGLFTSVGAGAKGAGGNLTLDTGHLSLRNGALVLTTTFGEGQAGDLNVTARESVEVIGTSANGKFSSGLLASVGAGAKGAGGNLTLDTGRLSLRDGAQVSSGTFGEGRAGELKVTARESVELIGTSADGRASSGLFTQVGSTFNPDVNLGIKGAGGNLTIETGRLIVRNGAVVSASTFAQGLAGSVNIIARDSVEVIGRGPNGNPSELRAKTTTAYDAGNLRVETGRLFVRDGAQITVSSTGSGKAGNLNVTANRVLLDNNGKLVAETASGEGGNINLQVEDLLLMRRNSLISAQASNNGNGGNINIQPGLIVAIPTEDSDIVADAQDGKGGNINITTAGIFDLEFRPQGTPLSDITASSNIGLSGTVTITERLVNPKRGQRALPTNLVDRTNQIDQTCSADGANRKNTFSVTGRGGLPQSPTEVISPDMVQDDFGILATEPETRTDATPSPRSTNPPNQLVEAQGWIIGSDGKVILTASAPNVTPQETWLPSVNCQLSQTDSP
jgi:filamentous hemagglutinin family protein